MQNSTKFSINVEIPQKSANQCKIQQSAENCVLYSHELELDFAQYAHKRWKRWEEKRQGENV